MKKSFEIKIYGLVQGVTFRYSAKKVAMQLGVVGFIRNESDGSVFVIAEGDQSSLDKFVEWCKIGPLRAKVEKVICKQNKNLQGFKSFESIHAK